MIATIEALALLAVLGLAILVYRRLIHSRWFSNLVVDVTHPSPEDDVEVIQRLDSAEELAQRRAKDAEQEVVRLQRTAETIRRRTRSNP
jgi:ABC-type phosphate transport system auxiliary subunit